MRCRSTGSSKDPPGLDAVRERVDGTIDTFLLDVRAEMEAVARDATLPVDEIRRMIEAGGKRCGPPSATGGTGPAGGADGEPIVRVGAALELLHTMALIHDDLMDGATERRGVPASAVAARPSGAPRRGSSDPERAGRALAHPGRRPRRRPRGPALPDIRVRGRSGSSARSIGTTGCGPTWRRGRAWTSRAAGTRAGPCVGPLKGGAYTVEGPLRIGAALAGAPGPAADALAAYGAPLGMAFQLRDDERDGDVTLDAGSGSTRWSSGPGRRSKPRSSTSTHAERCSRFADLVEAG